MDQVPLLASLQYSELDHGWALDIGCFLAARCTALGSLAHAQDENTRSRLLEHIRSYSFNIHRRLAAHGSGVESSVFHPSHFHHMGSTMATVAAKLQDSHSTVHCVFLLLGSATTFIELGMKSGLRRSCHESASSVLKQLLAVSFNIFPAGTQLEALRFELTILGGNVDRLRRVLLATSKPKSPDNSYVYISDIRNLAVDVSSKEKSRRRLVDVVL